MVSGGSFNTSYIYDKHGNMITKVLNGLKAANSYAQVENLSMTYRGNQLINVHDTNTRPSLADTEYFQDCSKDVAKTKVEYTYNKNGAMTKDLNKGITEIRYNSLNLPRQMDIKSPQGEARNEYLYSASGQKLQVVQRYNSAYNKAPIIGTAINASILDKTKKTDYVGNKIYEGGLLKRILVDEGYYDATSKVYHFYLTDHLGNNRVVAKADGTPIQKTHYYPFGSAFAEGLGDGLQPYKYNGKELDKMHGLNLYDYSARHYDAAIGRFTTIDPLAEKYYSWSPYAYVMNNPLKYIDPDGKIIIPVHGTWSDKSTWKNLDKISSATVRAFGDSNLGKAIDWAGDNTKTARSEGALTLIESIKSQREGLDASEPVTLVGHSHGGNVAIEAINLMTEMEEFNGVEINLMTINTPVRDDYQLSEKASEKVKHVNVYDTSDPVQVRGASTWAKSIFGGGAKRTFEKATNIAVDNPQGATKDYHNSHNRVDDWKDKIKSEKR